MFGPKSALPERKKARKHVHNPTMFAMKLCYFGGGG